MNYGITKSSLWHTLTALIPNRRAKVRVLKPAQLGWASSEQRRSLESWEQVEIIEIRAEKCNGDLTKTGKDEWAKGNRKHCRSCHHQYPTMPKANTLRYQTFKECTTQEMTVGWRKLLCKWAWKKCIVSNVNLKFWEKLLYLVWPKEHIFANPVKPSIHLLCSYSKNAFEDLSRQA